MPDLIAERFLRFAAEEAAGSSPLYAELARGVAGDPDILAFLAGLPAEKQQPNLLFAALRHLCGTPADWPAACAAFGPHAQALRLLMLRRRTQTNEPARCATLLPVLADLPQPLALLEVGAAAGLCLLPDRYGYAYGTHRLAAPGAGAPEFPCRCGGNVPLPETLPRVAWRAGLDVAPLAVTDAADCAWLETLVWPEHAERLDRLRAALRVARADPPPVRRGDLTADLPARAAGAPDSATLVVFHSAVLAYVAERARPRFAAMLRRLDAVWISNEAPGVFPEQIAQVRRRGPPGAFLLAVDNRPVAWTHPHGAWIEWLEPEDVAS